MIYIRIWGGLGNQMFQFAAAANLAKIHKTRVGICLDRYKAHNNTDLTKRVFELDSVFCIDNYELVDSSRFSFISSDKRNLLDKIKYKLLNASFFFETSPPYNSAILKLSKETYIEGYFQTEQYFKEFESSVLANFKFKKKPSQRTSEMLELAKNKNAIAVHVRRGDYLSNKKNLSTHGVCSTEYYQRAIEKFSDLDNVLFVVLSDEPEWAKENLVFGQSVVFVDWNQAADSWQDMLIMSACKHAIIANSSFSWWGAKLIQYPQKRIVAPAIWYANSEIQNQTQDLIPTSWIKIK